MKINICFKIPGEDVTISTKDLLVKDFVEYIKSTWYVSCIAGIYINGRKIHLGGVS